MLPDAIARLSRRLLLAHGRRMDPQRMLERSRQGALQAAVRASRQSRAYRTLLLEHGIDPAALGSVRDLERLPVLSKANTFGRFALDDLARPVAAEDLADVLTSSGRSGSSFGFKLTTRKQLDASSFDIDLGLQDAFGIDQRPTLLVNCLPMGVVFRSRAVAVANVSTREDMACAILRDVGPRFAQTILCTDPLFIRRILAEASLNGIDWSALNTSVILGEEILVESQRDYIAHQLGIDVDGNPKRLIGSSFGAGELGLNIFFETRETISIRRAMRSDPEVARRFAGRTLGASMPSVFCYNPLRFCVEVLTPDGDGYGELCFTALAPDSVIPLPRFRTGDIGRLAGRSSVCETAASLGLNPPWLPVALVRGRLSDRGADSISVEEVKELLYQDHQAADQLSGAFRLESTGSGMVLFLQALSEEAAADPRLQQRLRSLFGDRDPATRAVEVRLLGPSGFPDRPAIDFQRKYPYITSPSVGPASREVSKFFTA